MTPEEFQALAEVSADTLGRLKEYVALVEKWQRRINLVGRSSLADVWRRHLLDSAQLAAHLPGRARNVVDLGSGAGFPGLVLAVMGPARVHLVESDSRKCIFLREAIRITAANAEIHHCRIEAMDPFAVDAITARACAPLAKLLEYALPFVGGGGACLFLKGRKAQRELTDSLKIWMMRVTRIRSISDPSGEILKLEDISRRHD